MMSQVDRMRSLCNAFKCDFSEWAIHRFNNLISKWFLLFQMTTFKQTAKHTCSGLEWTSKAVLQYLKDLESSFMFVRNKIIRDKFATQKKKNNIPQVQRMEPLKNDYGFQAQRISWLRWPFAGEPFEKKHLRHGIWPIILTSLDFPKIARNLPFPLTKKKSPPTLGGPKKSYKSLLFFGVGWWHVPPDGGGYPWQNQTETPNSCRSLGQKCIHLMDDLPGRFWVGKIDSLFFWGGDFGTRILRRNKM